MRTQRLWSVIWGLNNPTKTLIVADTFDKAVEATVAWMQQEKPDAGMSRDHITEVRDTGTCVLVA